MLAEALTLVVAGQAAFDRDITCLTSKEVLFSQQHGQYYVHDTTKHRSESTRQDLNRLSQSVPVRSWRQFSTTQLQQVLRDLMQEKLILPDYLLRMLAGVALSASASVALLVAQHYFLQDQAGLRPSSAWGLVLPFFFGGVVLALVSIAISRRLVGFVHSQSVFLVGCASGALGLGACFTRFYVHADILFFFTVVVVTPMICIAIARHAAKGEK